jgi:hypothetical protein
MTAAVLLLFTSSTKTKITLSFSSSSYPRKMLGTAEGEKELRTSFLTS